MFEDQSTHLMISVDKNILAVGRLHMRDNKQAQIRYMAVDSNYRNEGLGTTMVEALEQAAREQNAKEVLVNARENVTGFYMKLGYRITGDAHTLFGKIKHKAMIKTIA